MSQSKKRKSLNVNKYHLEDREKGFLTYRDERVITDFYSGSYSVMSSAEVSPLPALCRVLGSDSKSVTVRLPCPGCPDCDWAEPQSLFVVN